MSNLLKALKRAERDRQAALDARQPSPLLPAEMAAGVALQPDGTEPRRDDAALPVTPAVVRRQRDAARLPPRPASREDASTGSRYRGVLVSLALAVCFAAAIRWWVYAPVENNAAVTGAAGENVSTRPAPVAVATAAQSSDAPAATLIPAALRMQEAGPLQLRLDRALDSAARTAAAAKTP